MPKTANYHHWTWGDDVTTFYVEKFGPSLTGLDEMQIARLIGVQRSTFNMRKGNFRHLIGKDQGVKVGLNHPAQQSVDVYEQYKTLDKPTLLRIVMEYLEEMKNRRSAA